MNTFEKAQQKYERNRLSQGRPLPVSTIEETLPPVVAPVAAPVEAPKEKRVSANCVIKVSVSLPDAEFAFDLVKGSVYQNVNRSKMTPAEIKKAMQVGLRPLMGEVT